LGVCAQALFDTSAAIAKADESWIKRRRVIFDDMAYPLIEFALIKLYDAALVAGKI